MKARGGRGREGRLASSSQSLFVRYRRRRYSVQVTSNKQPSPCNKGNLPSVARGSCKLWLKSPAGSRDRRIVATSNGKDTYRECWSFERFRSIAVLRLNLAFFLLPVILLSCYAFARFGFILCCQYGVKMKGGSGRGYGYSYMRGNKLSGAARALNFWTDGVLCFES